MPTCAAGHDSATGDYCDVCGSPIARSAAPAATAARQTCPGCGSPQTGRFCEECGFDFEAPAEAATAAAAGSTAAHLNGSGAWTAVVSADRSYFDAVEADSGPDGGPVVFPPYCPLRSFELAGDQIRVGRRSASRGIAPEIDLTGPPLDPGISHLHLLLN